MAMREVPEIAKKSAMPDRNGRRGNEIVHPQPFPEYLNREGPASVDMAPGRSSFDMARGTFMSFWIAKAAHMVDDDLLDTVLRCFSCWQGHALP